MNSIQIRQSNSVLIRDLLIKIPMRYHFYPPVWQFKKKKWIRTTTGRDLKKSTLARVSFGNINIKPFLQKYEGKLTKFKNKCNCSNPSSGNQS